MATDSGSRLFRLDDSGKLTDRPARDSRLHWTEFAESTTPLPVPWTRLARSFVLLFLSHLIPALAVWLSWIGIARLLDRAEIELNSRWEEYVRTDPTIHGALRE